MSTADPPAATPTTLVAAVPGSPPVFLGGGDCDATGPFVRWVVENRDVVAHDLVIETRGEQPVEIALDAGEAAGGTFLTDRRPNEPRRFVAGWSDAPESRSVLVFRPDLCAPGYETPARGPTFVAGASCVDDTPTIEWHLENSAPSDRVMNVTVTDDRNEGEVVVWPEDGGTVQAVPGADLDGSAPVPAGFAAGAEIRVRAWWRTNDPNTHSRVAAFVPEC
ncbi:MAG TPA: hypothetical protein VGC47_04965 [Acidimicrobiia bacterium]